MHGVVVGPTTYAHGLHFGHADVVCQRGETVTKSVDPYKRKAQALTYTIDLRSDGVRVACDYRPALVFCGLQGVIQVIDQNGHISPGRGVFICVLPDELVLCVWHDGAADEDLFFLQVNVFFPGQSAYF